MSMNTALRPDKSSPPIITGMSMNTDLRPDRIVVPIESIDGIKDESSGLFDCATIEVVTVLPWTFAKEDSAAAVGEATATSLTGTLTKEDSIFAVGEANEVSLTGMFAKEDSAVAVGEANAAPGAGWYFSLHSSVN